jgi:alpha-glucosidase
MISHYERMYLKTTIDSIKSDDFCSLPVLFQKEGGVNLFFSEADLFDYPNLFLRKANDNEQFKAIFPHVVLSIDIKDSDRNERITSEAEYIALTSGNRTFPWRIFALAEKDADLVNNNMIYELSSPLKIAAADWIKPGKVAWDWWNDSNIYGVDFQSGINNETYKYYIDFAAKFGLDYIILDEGWSKTTTDIMNCQPQINVPELVEYGKPKNVGVILWTLWKPLDSNMDSVLNLYEKWGVKGIKVDFMQRADQYMVNFYERVAGEAASRHLLVDFHGAFKPTGMQKAYPNIVNYEGLKGMENTKWSRLITPEHNLTLPFTRMVAGPMDYTPGAMDNAHEKYFSIRWSRPMSMGTRCHQVAMYVVYEAPLQMLADNPSNYYKEEETTAFIAQIPTTWDTTIVLDARIGEWILLARKKADKWFIGGMTVREKTFNMDLSFLPKGVYEVEFMQDGINSDKNAEDYKHGKITITAPAKIQVNIHHGGGYAAIITKKKPE